MSSERLTLTVQEASEILGISRAHAYELVRTNDIPSVKLGRRIVVPRHALDKMIRGVTESEAS